MIEIALGMIVGAGIFYVGWIMGQRDARYLLPMRQPVVPPPARPPKLMPAPYIPRRGRPLVEIEDAAPDA